MIEIRPVAPDDWRQLRNIRLEALRTAPEAFCTTHEEAVCRPDDFWRKRAGQDGEGDALTVLAVDDGRAVGMATGILHDGDTTRDVEVLAVFVSDEVRGEGTADAILDFIESWAVGRGAKVAQLLVEEMNARARRFYEKRDFVTANEWVSSPLGADLWQARYTKDLTAA